MMGKARSGPESEDRNVMGYLADEGAVDDEAAGLLGQKGTWGRSGRRSSREPTPSAPELPITMEQNPSAPELSFLSDQSPHASLMNGQRSGPNTPGGVSRSASWQDVVDTYFSEGSIRGSVFNLCSATLGAGALSLPYAMQSMGVGLGLGVILLCAITSIFSIHLLVLARHHTGLNSYEEITALIFGSRVCLLVEVNIIAFCFGTGVAYCKTLKDFLAPLLKVLPEQYRVDEIKVMIGLWLLILLPLSMMRSMNSLRFSSLFGVLTIIYLVAAVTLHSGMAFVQGDFDIPWKEREFWVRNSWKDIVQALPIIMFAFTCQVNVFSIFEELQRASRPRMAKVAFRAVFLCLVLYSLIGVAGSAEYKRKVCGNILQNFAKEFSEGSIPVILMYVATSLTIMMAFPMVIHPMRLSLESIMTRYTSQAEWRHYMWAFVLSGGSLALSLLVPNINTVFQIIGGTSSAFVNFVVPAMWALELRVYAGRSLHLMALYALIVVGLAGGLLSTALTIESLYTGGSQSQCGKL